MTFFEILYLVSQYFIFFTGVIYAIFAYRQWRAIAEQAKIAADTLNVIKVQQRAQVVATIKSQESLEDFKADHAPRLRVQLKNIGLTPAYKCTYQTWASLIDRPFVGFSENVDHSVEPHQFTVYPGNEGETAAYIKPQSPLTPEEVTACNEGKREFRFRIRVQIRAVRLWSCLQNCCGNRIKQPHRPGS
jgi:hypothetical protein